MKTTTGGNILALGLFALGVSGSLGNPTGGSIASGSASISTVPGTVTINQSSNIAIINWQTFSIGAGELTKFVQPSESSAALNRVLGGQTSVINGSLQANGQLYLINGNGIVVGPGGTISASAFTASTRDMADVDFLNGNFHFTGSGNGGVVNQGTITAQSGDVYLIGKTVDNQGTIKAASGTAGLAAGDDVLLNLSGTEHVFVNPTSTATSAAGKTAVHNSGAISAASAELKAANGNLYALAINNEGTVRATSVAQVGGHVFLTTDSGMVVNNGTIASKAGANGGTVKFKGGSVWNRKTVDVSGKISGGRVDVDAANFQNDGLISATSATSVGGTVDVVYSGNALGSVKGLIDASGYVGGGNVFFLGTGDTSETYLSLGIDVSSQTGQGGRMDIDSSSIYLAGAKLNANGPGGNGHIFLGLSDPLYSPSSITAQTLYIGLGSVLSANATRYGPGGTIIAQSSGTSESFGLITANGRGGQNTHGTVIVPSTPIAPPVVGTTTGGGTGTTTGPGKPAPPFEFVDPNPGANNAFGRPVTGLFNLAGNKTLITSPGDSFGGAGAGAAYLFSDANGALLGTIRGTSAGDGVGTSVQFFSGGSFVIKTPTWNGGAGALTFGSAAHGFAGGGGAISATNSLVGSAAGDNIGSGGLVGLFNGDYVALSPNWNNNAGAATWVNPALGLSGTVSAANSLVGANGGDAVGSGGVYQLHNGANYLVLSPSFAGGAGAITNGSDAHGVNGIVATNNSLVGASAGEHLGTISSITDTNYGYYLVSDANWGGGAGAVAWNDSNGGATGVVSAANSLVGSAASDAIGSGGITLLVDNHNYVVVSPDWQLGTGAVTLGNGSNGAHGVVSAANSLVGEAPGDRVGSGGIQPLLGNSAFVVYSPEWHGTAGAVTLENDAFGVTGVVSSANSLVGSAVGDLVGSGGVTALSNGDIVILSPDWHGARGAATWADLSSGIAGVIGAGNSLVGATAGDAIGSGGVMSLANGSNFLVLSPDFAGGRGAITNGNDFSGVTGIVSSANSLVGAGTNDHVGAAGTVIDPFTGYYLVTTANYNSGAGAVTWNSDDTGTVGVIGATNSLVGSAAGDHLGSGGIQILYNGDYVVLSPDWNGNAGAVSWGSAFSGVSGTVSASTSLVGAAGGDRIGSGGIVQLSNAGNFLVLSPDWNGGRGAVTNVASATGLTGTVGNANSLTGAYVGDHVGTAGSIIDPFSNYYLVVTTHFNGGAGAVTWNAVGNGATGPLSATNSLVGSAASDHVGSGGVTILSNDNYVVKSPDWNGTAGAVTFGLASTGVRGAVSATNSLVGSNSGDLVGSGGLRLLPNGNFLVLSPNWNGQAGAVSWINSATGQTGAVSATNSLVGAAGGDAIGSGGIILLSNGANYLVLSPNWNGGAGAISNGRDASGLTGVIGAANSLVGANGGDGVGSSVLDTGYGYYLATSLNFDNGRGAVTWNSDATGRLGQISSANSLVGAASGDAIGQGGITLLTGNHGYVVTSTAWNGGRGAVTYGSATAGVSGVVGAGNSLVGANAGDAIGSGGIQQLSNGNFLVLSPDFNGSAGAVSFATGAGLNGIVSASNSLVGANPGDLIGSAGIALLPNGNYLVLSPDFGGGEGAVTFGSRVTGISGVVGAATSLVGTNSADHIGSGGIIVLSNGNYLVQSPLYGSSAGAVTWGSAAVGVKGQVTLLNSIVGGMPNAGEEYAGESADGTIYLVSFTTDSSAGGQGRVIGGSVDGPNGPAPLPNFFLNPSVVSVEASGFDFIAGSSAYYIADPNAPAHGSSGVDSIEGNGALNSGHGANLASGSSTEHASGPQRLVTPGNGVWNIFAGVVHSTPAPLFITHQLQLTLSPAVFSHLNEILFGRQR